MAAKVQVEQKALMLNIQSVILTPFWNNDAAETFRR